MGRIPPEELDELMRGYDYEPFYVEGSDPLIMHQKMAATMDTVITRIKKIQNDARKNGFKERPQWPMIVLRSPKGWTGPHIVDGQQIEGTFRAHQVPVSEVKTNPAHLKILNEWLLSYKPHELFDETGRLIPELAELATKRSPQNGGETPMRTVAFCCANCVCRISENMPLTFRRRASLSPKARVSRAI